MKIERIKHYRGTKKELRIWRIYGASSIPEARAYFFRFYPQFRFLHGYIWWSKNTNPSYKWKYYYKGWLEVRKSEYLCEKNTYIVTYYRPKRVKKNR